MRIIKKVFIGFLTIILIDLIVLLILNLSLKKFIINDILIESIKSNNGIINVENNNEIPIIANNEIIQEVLNDELMKEDISDFIDEFIKSLSDEDIENIPTSELQQKVIDYVKNNKEELSEKTGVEITNEMIDKSVEQLNDVDTQKSINQQINNYKNNLTKEEKIALKIFEFVNSKKFRLILIVSIISDILLIALLHKSTYKWIKNLSYAMAISGLSIVILAISIKYIISSMTMVIINTKSLITLGIITIIFGLIIQIIYRIMTKYYIKEKKNEVS